MFDLDFLEDDYKKNSFILSEDDIIEIYRREGATYSDYCSEVDKYNELTSVGISAEDRLLGALFGEKEILEKLEEEKKLKEQYEYPKKKHLSSDSQKIVVEGSLYIVFDATRKWYEFLKEKVSLEDIYYICLLSLINSVKYLVHNEKPCFKYYVEKSIRKNIIKYLARINHISYNEMYNLIDLNKIDDIDLLEFEESMNPSRLFYLTKDYSYDVDYIKNVSSLEFMDDYKESLENLDDTAKMIMMMSFDNNGNRGLTINEISDYLGFSSNTVRNVRRKSVKLLRKNKVFLYYKNT